MTAPATTPAPAASVLGAAASAPSSAPAEGAPASPAAGTAPAAGAPSPDAAKPEGAQAPDTTPAPADLDIKLPEGLASGEAFDAFKATAKELGLDGPKAQKLIDLYAGQQSATVKAQEQAFAQQQAKWAAELQADPAFGGAKLQESASLAVKALERFSPGLAGQLDAMGLGNHPGLLRFAAAVGRALADDSIGGSSAGAGRDDSGDAFLRAMYPNSPTMFSKE